MAIDRLCGLRKSRPNGAELYVREDDLSIRAVRLDLSRDAARDIARATSSTWGFRVAISGIGRVEPEHVGVVV
jgi:hypothetical protein